MIENLHLNIEQVHAKDFRGYEIDKPLLIKEGVKFFFPKIASWTANYLSQAFGDVQVKVSRDSRPVLGNAGKQSLFAFFADLDESLYAFDLCSFSPSSKTPMAADLSFPNPVFSESEVKKTVFYAGDEGLGASPHSHGQAFNLLTHGAKLWAFWDARTAAGEELVTSTAASFSAAEKPGSWWAATDFQNFPVPLTIGLQEAGDIIIVPAKFAHTVRNVSYTIGFVCICADPSGLDKFNSALFKNRSESSVSKVPISVVEGDYFTASAELTLATSRNGRRPFIIRGGAAKLFPDLQAWSASITLDAPFMLAFSNNFQREVLVVESLSQNDEILEKVPKFNSLLLRSNQFFEQDQIKSCRVQKILKAPTVTKLCKTSQEFVDISLSGQKQWFMWDMSTKAGAELADRLGNCPEDWSKVDLDSVGISVFDGIQMSGDVVYVPSNFAIAFIPMDLVFMRVLVEN